MFSKAWKVVKEIAIGVLLVLSLWLVIGGAYKKDIGNLSDWISSISTFLTLIVAYMAYKSAPKWLQQKYDETAFSIASPLIEEKIPLAKSSLKSLEHALNELSRLYYSIFPANSDGSIALIKVELNKLVINHRSVTSDLRKLERLNWHLINHKSEVEALSSLDTIQHWLNKIPMINYEYQDKRGVIKNSPPPFAPTHYIELLNEFEIANNRIIKFYTIFEDSNPYNSYFNSTRNKKDNNEFFID